MVLSLLDDFFAIGRTKEVTQIAFDLLLEALDEVGLPFHPDKTKPPNQDEEVLGVQFTAEYGHWKVGLPKDKATNLVELLTAFVEAPKRPTKRDVLSVAGKLGFAHQIWSGARSFVSEMFKVAYDGGYETGGAHGGHRRVR